MAAILILGANSVVSPSVAGIAEFLGHVVTTGPLAALRSVSADMFDLVVVHVRHHEPTPWVDLLREHPPHRLLVLGPVSLESAVRSVEARRTHVLVPDSGPETVARAIDAILSSQVEEQVHPPADTGGVGSDWATLSPRELEVLACLAEGLTNREIAARLHITATTVGCHVSAILHRLGVKSRVQAATLYTRLASHEDSHPETATERSQRRAHRRIHESS